VSVQVQEAPRYDISADVSARPTVSSQSLPTDVFGANRAPPYIGLESGRAPIRHALRVLSVCYTFIQADFVILICLFVLSLFISLYCFYLFVYTVMRSWLKLRVFYCASSVSRRSTLSATRRPKRTRSLFIKTRFTLVEAFETPQPHKSW
jgi:hypothetical protein